MNRSRAVKTYRTYRDIPKTWDALTRMHPMRPIHDDVDLENATEIVDLMAGHKLNHDQDEYLDALTTLVSAYETKHHPVDTSHISGLDSLRSILEDQGMGASDLGRLLGVHRSHASKILKGARSLTVDHLRVLAARFKVSPELFM